MSNEAIPGEAKHADSAIEVLQQIGQFLPFWSFFILELPRAQIIGSVFILNSPLPLFVDLCFDISLFILFTFQFAFLQAEGERQKV